MTATANGHHADPRDGRQSNGRRPNGRPFGKSQRRDALLSGVAEAARRLLAIADFDVAVNGALEAIATAADIDRIFVYQHRVDVQTQREFADCSYEWTVPGIVRSCDLAGQFPMFYDEIPGYVDWVDELKAGHAVQRLAAEMSAAGQEKQIKEQALSVLTVPIFVEGRYWGNFGFDDCATERVWSKAEIAVLQTAAASFSGALQRRGYEAELQRRDELLNSVNAAAQCLVATDDLEQAIPAALRILGERTRQDRVYVFENVFSQESSDVLWNVPYEWVSLGIPSSDEVADKLPIPMSAFPACVNEPILDGQPVQFLSRELGGAAKEINEVGQTLALVAVPINVAGRWWGVLGFDDCTTERIWSDAEIAVLETAAACIGSAIERDRTRKDREAAARARAQELETHNQVLARRDRILQATATASNVLLNGEDFDTSVSEALAILGESLGFDRIGVGQQFDDPTRESSGFVRFLYEWDGPGISAQLQDFENMADFHWDEMGLRSWYEANLRGEAFSQFLEELPVPFRTLMQAVDAKSTHNIPIFVEGQFWGVFGIDHCREKKLLSAVELVALKTAANCVGGAIARDRTRKEREVTARSRAEELAQVNSVLKDSLSRLASEPDLNIFLGHVIDSINKAVGAAKGHVFLHDADANTLELLLSVQRGTVHIGATDNEPRLFHSAFPADITPAYPEMCQTDEIALFSLIGRTPAMWPGNAEWHRRCGHVEAAAVTLRSGDRPIGMLGLSFTEPVTITNEGKALIQALADQAAVAIDLARLAEENKKTAVVCEREAAARARAEELEAHNQALAERDRILDATAAAANVMLTDDTFSSAVNSALQIIGIGLGLDRVGLMKTFDATDAIPGYHQQIYEWTGVGLTSQLNHPELVRISERGIEHVGEQLARGEIFGGVVADLPEPFRSRQQELGVQSTYAVPVMVDGSYWGLIGLDDCHRQTRRSEAELEALRTLANCIGSAIEREQLRQAELQAQAAREAAERNVLLERERAAQERAAQLQSSNEILSLRDRWLGATAAAAEQLLSGDNLEIAIAPALQTIGESIGVDRVGIMQKSERDGHEIYKILSEWTSPEQPIQAENDDLKEIPVALVGERLDSLLENGNWTGGDIDDEMFSDDFRNGQKSIGVQSTYAVPILIDGYCWGLVGIDHCREKKLLTETEIAVFQTIASCFASAIQRDQIRQAREAAERTALIERERAARAAELEAANAVLTTRDRWLETTAAAANQLLSSDDVAASVNEALETIGENLDCDRVVVMEYIRDPDISPDDLGLMRLLYEWNAEGIVAQIDAPELLNIPADGIEDWLQQLLKGQYVGGVVAELDEPFRSGQQKLGVQSTYGVPVFVEGTLWGIVAMDHCREARRLSAAELAVFRTAATCVGSAIYQARVRRDRAAQERARLLSSVAEVANLLLRSADYTTVLPEVVRLLGEAVGSDRCGIVTTQSHPVVPDVPIHFAAEWCKDGVLAGHDATPELAEKTWQQFPELYEQLLNEEAANYLVTDLSEPNRYLFESQGVSSVVYLPITVDGQPWGQIGFDNCGEPRLYDEAEIAILRVAAESIAAAISRQAQEESTREAEERYRNLIELSTEGIYRLELDEPIPRSLPVREQVELFYKRCYGAEANDAFAAMYGYQTAEEMIGWRLTDIHVKASEQNIEFLSEWLASPDCRISNSESEERDISGNMHYFLNNVIGIVENNCLVRVWGTQTDVTELKQIQKAREEAEKAVLAEREKAARSLAAELAKTNEAISQTLNTLASKPQLSEFLGQLLLAIAQQINSRKVHLFLYDEASHTLNLHTNIDDGQVYAGASSNDVDFFHHPIPADITPAWQLISEAEDIVMSDLSSPLPDEFWWPGTKAWHQTQGHVSMACIPMKAGEQALGFIGFAFRDRTILTNEQLEFMQALTNQAIVAIQLTRLAEEAKQAAILQERENAAQERVVELAKTNEAIAQSLTDLAANPELDPFLGTIIAEMARQLNAAKVHLFLYDESTHTLTQRVAVQDGRVYLGAGPKDPEMFRHPIPTDITPGWQFIMTSDRPLTFDETQPYDEELWWPESLAWHKAQGHKAITCIPMKAGDAPIGYIGFCFYDRTILTDEQLEFMQALANQAIVAIQLTRLAEEAKQSAILQEQEKAAQERAAQLTRSNQALKSSLDSLAQQSELEAFLQRVVNEAVAQTGAANGHLFLYDSTKETFSLHVATENRGDWRSVQDMELWLHPVPTHEAPTFFNTINAKKPFCVQDLQANLKPGPDVWQPSIQWHLQRGHQSLICAPLVMGEQVLGFMGLAFVEDRSVTQDDIELAQALSNQATLAVQLTRLAEQARTNALNDERTRLAREIHDTLAQAFTGVSLQLEAVRDITTSKNGSFPSMQDFSEAQTCIRRARDLARSGLSEARRSVRALRSEALETDPLPDALRKVLRQTQRDTGLETHFTLEGPFIPLPDDLELNLLRISQEAITNTLRHAQATRLDLTLCFTGDRIQLRIVDDGNGFDPYQLAAPNGFGLLGIRERTTRFYGSCNLISSPGSGTTLEITIPIQNT